MDVEVRMHRLEDALSRLAEAQVHTAERMEQVEAALARLAEAQARTEERVGRLEERLERVEAALLRLTEAQVRTEDELKALVSWQRGEAGRGERLAVVEIAIQVNGEDVSRAVQRAQTLRHGGAQASPVVIGESWATLDTRERARTLGVEWKVGADLSEGFLAFRRQPPEEENDRG